MSRTIAVLRRFAVSVAAILLVSAPLAGSAAALKTLTGHVPAVISRLTAKAALPDTNRLSLAIGLPLRDSQGLETFLSQITDPASPNFRQYLTPDEFTARFGPSEADYDAVAAFAQSNHLTVTARHANRLVLDVNGAVADVQRALHLHLHTYRHPTENRDFFAPDAEPSIDASLPIADISGLNNFVRPRPHIVHRDASVAANATPQTGSSLNGGYIGSDFRAAYLPGVSLKGSGQIVGLLEFDGFYASDITDYTSAAGYSAVPVQTVLLDGYNGNPTTGRDSGNDEVSLDIEVAIALAPSLTRVVSFEAGPNGFQNDVLNAMAASNQIKQFSCSWGWGGGPSATTDNIFKEMAAQGQSFFTAAGDSDAFTTGTFSANGVDNPSLANAPASSPYLTAVGATTLTTTGPGGSWSSEKAWNWGLDQGSYVGTSGGVSSYYPLPSWQSAIGMSANGGSTSYRNTPDVAFTGDNVYVRYGNGGSTSLGGTSCAAPLWAAFAALMNQQAAANGGPTVGFVNPALYAIAQSSAYASCFHDIATGNNISSDSPSEFNAVAGYDLCDGLGTPAGQPLINAMVSSAAVLPNSLAIAPASGFAATGPVGGPFSPASQSYVLTNANSSSVTWSLSGLPNWLAAAPTNGVLPGNGAASVTVSFNTTAGSLSAGAYNASLVFSNITSRVVVETIPVSVTPVGPVAFNRAVKTSDAFTLSWTAATGISYQVQYTTNLLNAQWVNLGAPQVATGNTLTLTDNGATAAAPQRFYRLVVAP